MSIEFQKKRKVLCPCTYMLGVALGEGEPTYTLVHCWTTTALPTSIWVVLHQPCGIGLLDIVNVQYVQVG